MIVGFLVVLGIEDVIVVGYLFGVVMVVDFGLLVLDCVKGFCFFVFVMYFWFGGVNWYYMVVVLLVLGWIFCWIIMFLVVELLVLKVIVNVFCFDKVF